MLQVIALVVVLGLVYAAKAASVARAHDELSAQAATFSWMRPRTYEDVHESAEATIDELSEQAQPRPVVAAPRALIHA